MSYVIGGCSFSVTSRPLCVSQCAEIERMALGFGTLFAISRHAVVHSFDSIAFIGLPCPTNRTGMRSLVANGGWLFIACIIRDTRSAFFSRGGNVKLQGATVLVTGGSSGIGFAIAKALGDAGAQVAI